MRRGDLRLAVPVLLMGDAARCVEGYTHVQGETRPMVSSRGSGRESPLGPGAGCVVVLTGTGECLAAAPDQCVVPFRLHFYFDHIDAVVRRGLGCGASLLLPRGDGRDGAVLAPAQRWNDV
jgi:hypothetical protein